MTIKDMKDMISDLPDSMNIFVDERITDFRFGLVNSAKVKEIEFSEEPNGKALSKENVLVLSED